MAYLIARIERAEYENVPRGAAPIPVEAKLVVRRRTGDPKPCEMRVLLEKHGFEMPSTFQANREDYPLIAYIYVSPNREGVGRCGSSLYRRLCRRKEENQR